MTKKYAEKNKPLEVVSTKDTNFVDMVCARLHLRGQKLTADVAKRNKQQFNEIHPFMP